MHRFPGLVLILRHCENTAQLGAWKIIAGGNSAIKFGDVAHVTVDHLDQQVEL